MTTRRNTILAVTTGAVLLTSASLLLANRLRRRQEVAEDLDAFDVALPGTQFASINDQLTAYIDSGSGDTPLIFIHGFGGCLNTWTPVISALPADHRSVCCDLWGFGASVRRPTLSIHDWPTQIFSLLDRLNIPSAVFVGHSLGGRVALHCADVAPQRVRGLVLIDSDGSGLPQGYPLLWAVGHTALLHRFLCRMRRNRQNLKPLFRLMYSDAYPITSHMLEMYRRFIRVRDTEIAWQSLAHSYPGPDVADLAKKITCPTLLIWGADDPIIPVQHALRLAAALPHAELVVLPHQRHLPHEEQPGVVANYLTQFLTKI